jgi:hypothetical protein
MDSMGRRGCTDGTSRGCLDCPNGAWIMHTITGCFDDSGIHPDTGRLDAFVPVDTGASDAGASDAFAIDAAMSIDAGGDASSTVDAGADASAADASSADANDAS